MLLSKPTEQMRCRKVHNVFFYPPAVAYTGHFCIHGHMSVQLYNVHIVQCTAVYRIFPTEGLDNRSQVEGTPHTSQAFDSNKVGQFEWIIGAIKVPLSSTSVWKVPQMAFWGSFNCEIASKGAIPFWKSTHIPSRGSKNSSMSFWRVRCLALLALNFVQGCPRECDSHLLVSSRPTPVTHAILIN